MRGWTPCPKVCRTHSLPGGMQVAPHQQRLCQALCLSSSAVCTLPRKLMNYCARVFGVSLLGMACYCVVCCFEHGER